MHITAYSALQQSYAVIYNYIFQAYYVVITCDVCLNVGYIDQYGKIWENTRVFVRLEFQNFSLSPCSPGPRPLLQAEE